MNTASALEALVRFYETLSRDQVGRIRSLYAPEARFKDPFNAVVGVEAIERIFAHLFEQVDTPRFRVSGRFVNGDEAMLVWRMDWRGVGDDGGIDGVSRLRFDDAGQVVEHRDFWDPAESLYERVPVLGALMRCIRRRLAAA